MKNGVNKIWGVMKNIYFYFFRHKLKFMGLGYNHLSISLFQYLLESPLSGDKGHPTSSSFDKADNFICIFYIL